MSVKRTLKSNAHASRGDAWKVDPADYAEQRPADHQLPPAPNSRYVPVTDGTRLAVDVYLPHLSDQAAPGPFPTVLILTPYYRRFKMKRGSISEPTPGNARYRDLFVPRGYAVVVVDVRGTGASFGSREGFRAPRERNDFYDITEWICSQPWSNGRVGAGGISYLGAGAEFLAGTGHPAVKAIAPLFAVWDTYMDNYFPGGVQLTDLIESYQQVMVGLDQVNQEALAPYPTYQHEDFEGGPQPVDCDTEDILLQQALEEHKANYRHTDFMREFTFREEPLPYDPDFSSATFSPYFYSGGVGKGVAIYSLSGWMDGAGYANGAIARFLAKQENPHHLMLGPWDHGARRDVSPWAQSIEPDEFWWYEILRFFDHYLMGLDTGLDQESPIHYYTMHEEKWHSAYSWPLEYDTTSFELTEGLTLTQASASPGTVEYEGDYGLGTGTSTRYEQIAAKKVEGYYWDWQGRPTEQLYFISKALDQEIRLDGHGLVELLVESSEPDAQLFVYVTEREADGTERYVTEGLLRLLHRKVQSPPPEFPDAWPYRSFTVEDAEPMHPGEADQVVIPLLPTSWRFSAGSQILLSISCHDKDHTAQSPHGRAPTIRLRIGPHANRLRLPSAGRKDELFRPR